MSTPEKAESMEVAIPPSQLSDEMAEKIAQFQLAQRKAKALERTDLLPKAHQGKFGNIVIICEIAQRMGMHELMVAQNLHVIHGKPGWSSSFLMAMLRASGMFRSFEFKFKDLADIQMKQGERTVTIKNRECQLFVVDALGQTIEGPPVSIEMAVKEGWYSRDGSKWPTMPDIMLRYRATSFFVRTCAPEVGLGLADRSEIEDSGPEINIAPAEEREERRPKLRNVTTETAEANPVAE